MSKSLMILGGSGFFGKTFLQFYLQEKLLKYKITKLILVSKKINYPFYFLNFKIKVVPIPNSLSISILPPKASS